jgi:citrate lyase subunit beta / citryl-CoA lyase
MIRSALFVPGDQLHLVDKLDRRPTDEQPDRVILDLEDSVAQTAKAGARTSVATMLASQRLGPDVVVRINGEQLGMGDVAAVCDADDPIICVPKADLHSVTDVIDAIQAIGRTPRVWALIESAAGLRDADRISRLPGVVRLALGEVDLCAELGVRPGAAHALWPLRMQLVTASILGGLPGPIGPVSTDFLEIERYERDSVQLRDAGFGGRLAIHPSQLSAIHRAFTPWPDEIRRAQRVIELFDEAAAVGRGAIVDDDGHMIDEAVVRAARRLIETIPSEERP